MNLTLIVYSTPWQSFGHYQWSTYNRCVNYEAPCLLIILWRVKGLICMVKHYNKFKQRRSKSYLWHTRNVKLSLKMSKFISSMVNVNLTGGLINKSLKFVRKREVNTSVWLSNWILKLIAHMFNFTEYCLSFEPCRISTAW